MHSLSVQSLFGFRNPEWAGVLQILGKSIPNWGLLNSFAEILMVT